MTASAPVLALDIGGTKNAAGVVDASGRVHSFRVAPSNAADGPAVVLPRLFELGRWAVEESDVPWSRIGAVGIGCGGAPAPPSGGVISPPPPPRRRAVPLFP